MFKLQPREASEADVSRLELMAKDYNKRILWKRNQIEAKRHPTDCVDVCTCKTRQEEIHDWEDWAVENLDKPWELMAWSTPDDDLPALEPPPVDRSPGAVLRQLGIPSKRV